LYLKEMKLSNMGGYTYCSRVQMNPSLEYIYIVELI